MRPNPNWDKHEKDAMGYVGLSLERARRLHAAISIRDYGIWSLILTAWHKAAKLDDGMDLTVSLGFSIVAVALFCTYLTASFLDSQRQRDVKSCFWVGNPAPRHHMEEIAIPAFSLGFIGFAILGVFLKVLNLDPASPLGEQIGWFFLAFKSTPWMGLMAFTMAVGAWLRWREASPAVLPNQELAL